MTNDINPLEPKVNEFKFFARGVGPVLAIGVSGGSDREELLSYRAGLAGQLLDQCRGFAVHPRPRHYEVEAGLLGPPASLLVDVRVEAEPRLARAAASTDEAPSVSSVRSTTSTSASARPHGPCPRPS